MDTVFRPTWTVGVIRVITQDQEQADAHGLLIERAFPQVRVVSRCIPDQPEGVHDAATKRTAEPKVIALACQLVEQDADGIIVSCADDPGVAEAHEGPVGVIGITPDAPPAFPRILGERLLANLVPDGVRDTRDLNTPAGQHAAITTARRLREEGAAVIALACTGFSTIGLAPQLERAAGIPVLDPVTCEAQALLALLA